MKIAAFNKVPADRRLIKQAMKDFYNSGPGYLSMLEAADKEPFNALLTLMQKWVSKGARVLDLGCGYGFSSYLLSQNGYRVVGVDLSAQLIQRAIDKYGNFPNVCFRAGDAESLEFNDAEFDAVVSWALLEHIVDVPKAIDEMLRVVKKHGRILIFAANIISPMTPLDNLKRLMRGEKGRLIWGSDSKIKSLLLIMKNIFLTITKLLKRKAEFEYLRPILNQIGPDCDRTWKSNQIDIKRYFLQKKCRVLQYQVPGRKLQFLDHFDVMVQIVAEKI